MRFDSIAPAPLAFGPTFGCSFSRLPRRSIVVKSSDSGSALILVLLITALLATITVSFLSTSRVEQIAAKNFSRQNAASGLAELATQQAISNLNTAFNASANMSGNYTAIVTSQPGRIQKFFFQNGTYTKNASVDLFFNSNSTNANGTVNMNNLDNSTSSPLAGLITGNPSESITVYFHGVLDLERKLRVAGCPPLHPTKIFSCMASSGNPRRKSDRRSSKMN